MRHKEICVKLALSTLLLILKHARWEDDGVFRSLMQEAVAAGLLVLVVGVLDGEHGQVSDWLMTDNDVAELDLMPLTIGTMGSLLSLLK